MARRNVEWLEELLLRERARTLADMHEAEAEESPGQRDAAGDIVRIPQHSADAGSDTQEMEKDFANIMRESEQLARIDEALRLLREDPDAYLRCARCSKAIEGERLELVPWARLCAACARVDEAVLA